MKIIAVILVLSAWAYVCHLAGKFCGFNQLGHDDDAHAAGTKSEVARESEG